MTLTTAQYQTLKTAINAETDPTFVGYRQTGQTGAMANWYNLAAVPAFAVWRTDAPVSAILDGITWTNFTPTDVADGSGLHTERVLITQTKQMNLQTMVFGRDTIDASKANIRAGLRDAVIQLPTGASGAAVSAGGASGINVLTPCTRSASNAEKVFAGAPATTGSVTANLLGWEGKLTDADIVQALNS
jgi:hypothetical protein